MNNPVQQQAFLCKGSFLLSCLILTESSLAKRHVLSQAHHFVQQGERTRPALCGWSTSAAFPALTTQSRDRQSLEVAQELCN